MKKRYYLAYGSNLNVEQMSWRCPDAVPVGTAVIEGYELLFKGSKTGSYLTIEEREGSSVPVAVWDVSAADEKNLDRYEGFPAFYYKKDMDIRMRAFDTKRMRKAKAFIYIMHEDRKCGIPSKGYVETCSDGYHDFGFDTDILVEAIRESRRREGKC